MRHLALLPRLGTAAALVSCLTLLLAAPIGAATADMEVAANAELLASAQALFASFQQGSPLDRMRSGAHAAAGLRPLDHDDREDWSYWPRERSGVQLQEMSAEQRGVVQDLLGATLSAQGHLKVVHIMLLEEVLRQTDAFGLERDVGNYRLTFFGEPNGDVPWGYRFEGHHVSLNVSVSPSGTSVTPSFLGSNPGRLQAGVLAGLRVLRLEEDLGRQLARSLGAGQEAGRSDAKPPSDVVSGPLGKARSEWDAWRTELRPDGLRVTAMNETQREIVRQILDEVLGNYRPHIAAAAKRKIDFDALHFLWIGGLEPGEPHYYRLQGGSFVFEYDNVQGGANHVHTVWRDRASDFGADLLREHYEKEDHR